MHFNSRPVSLLGIIDVELEEPEPGLATSRVLLAGRFILVSIL